MDKIKVIYYSTLGFISAMGSAIANGLGGWDTAIQTLCIIMALDYLTGIIGALFFKNSNKSESGAFNSKASIEGLFKKGLMLLIIYLCNLIDIYMQTNFLRNASIMFFIANDGLSIVENIGLMGVPLPTFIQNAFEVLKNKSENIEKE